MKLFDILPVGEENAIPGTEINQILGITSRERRTLAAKELDEGLPVLYTTAEYKGYFKPSPGEKGRKEIERFRSRELSRLRSISRKVKAADAVLKECEGQTQLDPPGNATESPDGRNTY